MGVGSQEKRFMESKRSDEPEVSWASNANLKH